MNFNNSIDKKWMKLLKLENEVVINYYKNVFNMRTTLKLGITLIYMYNIETKKLICMNNEEIVEIDKIEEVSVGISKKLYPSFSLIKTEIIKKNTNYIAVYLHGSYEASLERVIEHLIFEVRSASIEKLMFLKINKAKGFELNILGTKVIFIYKNKNQANSRIVNKLINAKSLFFQISYLTYLVKEGRLEIVNL